VRLYCIGGPEHNRYIETPGDFRSDHVVFPERVEPFSFDSYLNPYQSFGTIVYTMRKFASRIEHPCVRWARVERVWYFLIHGAMSSAKEWRAHRQAAHDGPHEERRVGSLPHGCPAWWDDSGGLSPFAREF
jgi:hypothetical protein